MAYGFEKAYGQGQVMKDEDFHFPVFVIPLAIGLMIHLARRKRYHMHMMNRANWENGVPPFFAEWHRRAHAAETAPSAAPAEPGVQAS
jgi:hypothetical protein